MIPYTPTSGTTKLTPIMTEMRRWNRGVRMTSRKEVDGAAAVVMEEPPLECTELADVPLPLFGESVSEWGAVSLVTMVVLED